MKKEKVVGKT